MSAFLYTWNPNKWYWSDLHEAIYRVNNDEIYDMYWSCGNTKRISIGDIFFLMRLGVEPKGIIGCGYISSEPYDLKHWDEAKAAEGKTTLRTDLLFKFLSEEPIVTLDYLKDRFPSYKWTPQAGGISIPSDVTGDLFSLIQTGSSSSFTTRSKNEVQLYAEGKTRIVTYKTYDRSPAARQACLEHYKYDCYVCGFNFSEAYGELGKQYIEVHHLKEISGIAEEYEIDPIKDLRPVCANCHRMLHKRRPVLSIEELKYHITSKDIGRSKAARML
jgi:5-methylcytosine-specific restriction protein A